MDDIELIIKIPKDYYEILRKNDIIINGLRSGKTFTYVICKAVANGTPLTKGHGRIVDIGKIEEDRIDDGNPIIYLTINGEDIEAISLDYLNNLDAVIESDNVESEKK